MRVPEIAQNNSCKRAQLYLVSYQLTWYFFHLNKEPQILRYWQMFYINYLFACQLQLNTQQIISMLTGKAGGAWGEIIK